MRFILLTFISIQFAFGQLITTEPPFATRNDSIIVIFNAAEGDQGLMGYSGSDVYAHTGVTIEGVGSWQYVNALWTDNLPHRKLTRIEGDLWKLVIGNPYDYYEVPEDKIITQLSFVFKNSNQSVTGRDVGGVDIFHDLYKPGLTIKIDQPAVSFPFGDPERSPFFVNADTSLDIRSISVTIGTQTAQQTLYKDGISVASTADDTLIFSYNTSGESGLKIFKIVAEDTAGLIDSSSFAVMIKPDITLADRPAGVEDGINYLEDGSVVLSLLAPYKENVFVIGDFNDWKVDPDYMMKQEWVSADEIYWWIQIDDLTPQAEYAFQYLVDGEIRIADPYSKKILHKDDKYISEQTYPNLKPYPEGMTDKSVAIIQTNQTPYDWNITTFEAPPGEELVIYELLIRDFVANHDFKTLKDTLDYLQNLGINAIELMPVHEFEGNESWGYNVANWIALDKYYGPADELKAFVDECHSRGIAVILDMVMNHLFGQSPMVELYLDYYGSDEIFMKMPNPWFNRQSPVSWLKYGADLNHDSKFTRYMVDRANTYWLEEFNVDGFRFDLTLGFTNRSTGGAYDESRIYNVKRMADAIWAVNPNAYVICEHWSDNTEEEELSDYGLMVWGHPNPDKDKGYYEAAMGYNTENKSDFSWGYFKTRGWTKAGLVTKIESHDEERFMFKNLTWGNSSGDYSVKDLSTALQRIKATAGFFFTIPGPKMFWQFMELGYDVSINQIVKGGEIDEKYRTSNKPILWNYFQEPERKKLYQTYAALLKLRKETQLFRDPASTVSLNVQDALKRISITGSDMNAIVVGNFDVLPSEIDPSFFHSGTWYDFFSGQEVVVTDTHEKIALAPGEFHIYLDEMVDFPDENPVANLDESYGIPSQFSLEQNYPNPFNPVTTIEYSLAKSSQVEIVIYNSAGKRIRQLVKDMQAPGEYTIAFNAINLASGIYFYSIKAGNFHQTRKMLLIK